MPVNPKELSLSERTAETPSPKAIINGTVIGPVVAPPESKAIPIKLFGAIKANTKLSIAEMQTLVDRVFADDKIRTCPHGRPIIISFDKKFIEKEFKRIV